MFDPVITPIAVGTAALGGAFLGADASRSAANTQADATVTAADKNLEAAKINADNQMKMFEEGRADTAPWREAGANALATLVGKINAGPGTYTSSPGYQFRLNEGLKAIQNSASARGNALNPSTLKALNNFAQDYATNDYQNFLSNYYASLTPFQSLAGVGQTTASSNAAAGNQVASSVAGGNLTATGNAGNAIIAGGQALAGGDINRANAITGSLNSGLNNYFMWKYLNNPTAPVVQNNNSIMWDGLGNQYKNGLDGGMDFSVVS